MDNNKRLSQGWMLTHCAICGDLLPRYQVRMPDQSIRIRTDICGCSEHTQLRRRRIRDDLAKQEAANAKRSTSEPITRREWRLRRDTQLGA